MGRITQAIKLLELYREEYDDEKRLSRLKEAQILILEETEKIRTLLMVNK